MRKNIFSLLLLIMSTLLVLAGSAEAVHIVPNGTLLEVIDENSGGVAITGAVFLDPVSLYTAGYYRNGGDWQAFQTSIYDEEEYMFAGGDILELVLMSTNGDEYGLSRTTSMAFAEFSDPGYDYYRSVTVWWDVPGLDPISASITIPGVTPPDGIAPATSSNTPNSGGVVPNPEPATLLLLGSGIAGFLVMERKKKNGQKSL